jgi:hypothetical protein
MTAVAKAKDENELGKIKALLSKCHLFPRVRTVSDGYEILMPRWYEPIARRLISTNLTDIEVVPEQSGLNMKRVKAFFDKQRKGR